MKRFPVLLSTAFAALILMTSCDDYAEGPRVSLRSKTSRIVNNWVTEFALVDGEDKTFRYDSTTFAMNEDGTFEFTTMENGDSIVQEGLWDLIEEETRIRLLYTDPVVFPDRTHWEIIRLRDKEFWVREDQDSTVYEFRFMPK
jgi:hypothetical protein